MVAPIGGLRVAAVTEQSGQDCPGSRQTMPPWVLNIHMHTSAYTCVDSYSYTHIAICGFISISQVRSMKPRGVK